MAVAMKQHVAHKKPPKQYRIFESVLKMELIILANPTDKKQIKTAMDRN